MPEKSPVFAQKKTPYATVAENELQRLFSAESGKITFTGSCFSVCRLNASVASRTRQGNRCS
jgi:hypothetical protein